MFINWAQRELHLKIVYYGPALSGKTTNLEYIHANTPAHLRTKLISLKTQQDRTLLFDFLQLDVGEVANLKPKFKLYTVPGQMYYAASRKIIMHGVDGVIFVADSQAGRMHDNQECWFGMEQHMLELGLSTKQIPITIQFNKRDLPHAVAVEKLRRPFPNFVCIEASAATGLGVLETLKASMKSVITQVRAQL